MLSLLLIKNYCLASYGSLAYKYILSISGWLFIKLFGHILASFPSRICRRGVINVSLSDHQLIFCTRKISKFKTGRLHKYINFRSLKNYGEDYKKSLGQLVFPNYEIFDDVSAAYSDFFQKIMAVVDTIAPLNIKKIPRSSLMVKS